MRTRALDVEFVYDATMRERWHENIVKLRLVDQRGEVRPVAWPSVWKLKRAGVPHPYRFLLFRLSTPRNVAVMFAVQMATFVVTGVALMALIRLFGIGLFQAPGPGYWDHQIRNLLTDISELGLLVLWLLLASAVAMKVFNRRTASLYVRLLLEQTKCPWCLYDLGGSVPENDGLTTCPECGGVWKMEEREKRERD